VANDRRRAGRELAVERTVVGIDLGSSKICTLVAEVNGSDRPRALGVGLAPARGVRKGAIVNVSEASEAIRASVDQAERASGYRIRSAFVSLSGVHVSSLNSRGVVGISRRELGITQADVDRALEAARSVAMPQNRELIHVIPRSFVVDGQTDVPDPVGMRGLRLEAEAHIVTAGSAAIDAVRQCVERAAVQVDDVVSASIAAGQAVLSAPERIMGVAVADIGAGTTDVAVYVDGHVMHTAVLGVGGEYVTSDVAIGLRLQPALAEQIKLQHGCAYAKSVAVDERFSVFPYSENTPRIVPRWRLAEIIEARVEEILRLVQREIRRSGSDGLLPAGVVLCGGTAQMPGLRELAEYVFNSPVRIGVPEPVDGLVEAVSGPAHAVGVGLTAWTGRSELGRESRGRGGVIPFVLDVLRGIFPS
jgi:cell division protein FtsA